MNLRFSASLCDPVASVNLRSRCIRNLRSLKIQSEPELLPSFRALRQRQPELRRLQAALIAEPVVDVEHVEHFPEGRGRSTAAEPENLAQAHIGALVG